MEQTPQEAFSERYQIIQALTPTDDSAEVSKESFMPISTFLSLSLFIFFFVVVFLGFLPLIIERFKNFKRFRSALMFALVSAAIPLTMALLFQRSGLLTRAYIEEIPRNVEISEVTSSSFRVSWVSNGEHYGSLHYGTVLDRSELSITVLESGGLVRKNNHEVVVEELVPATDYYFEILSGTRWFDNSGNLLRVRTLPY